MQAPPAYLAFGQGPAPPQRPPQPPLQPPPAPEYPPLPPGGGKTSRLVGRTVAFHNPHNNRWLAVNGNGVAEAPHSGSFKPEWQDERFEVRSIDSAGELGLFNVKHKRWLRVLPDSVDAVSASAKFDPAWEAERLQLIDLGTDHFGIFSARNNRWAAVTPDGKATTGKPPPGFVPTDDKVWERFKVHFCDNLHPAWSSGKWRCFSDRQSFGEPLKLTNKTKLMVEAAFYLLDRNGDGQLGKEDFHGTMAPVGVAEDTFKDADRVWNDLANEWAIGGKPAESIQFEQFIIGITKTATTTMTFSPERAGRPDEKESTIARWLQCLEEAANKHIEYLLARVLCIATVSDDSCRKVFDDLWARLCKRAGQPANADRVAALPEDEFWQKFWGHFDRFAEKMSTQASKKQRTENAHKRGLSKMELIDRFKRLAYMGPKDPTKESADSVHTVHTVFMSMMEKDKSSVTYEKFNVAMNAQLLLWLTLANEALKEASAKGA